MENFAKIIPLLQGNTNVVIESVLKGCTRGKVFVNDTGSPANALVWAQNEMFYLIGAHNVHFYSELEAYMLDTIKPLALQIGEDTLNLEILSPTEIPINRFFSNHLFTGKRVPFAFNRERYAEARGGVSPNLPSAYTLAEIDEAALAFDHCGRIREEIGKFWRCPEDFLQTGIGYCVFYEGEAVATCLSVACNGEEHEIGINTDAAHRGKGLATAMAQRFIDMCLRRGEHPHWTTEDFRLDSIAIAKKVGFEQLPDYPVYYRAFADFA